MLMPRDIIDDVRDVLLQAHQEKGSRPHYLTAYQILDRLPENLRSQLIEERTLGGKDTGEHYSAASLVSDATELLKPNIEIDYIDTEGLSINIAGTLVNPGYEVCGLYRIQSQ